MRSLNRTILKFPLAWAGALMLAVLAGCGSPPSTATATTASPAAAALQLSATSTSINSDNSNSTTITVTAVSATNSVIPGVVVTLSADTGLLSASSVTTGTNGAATFTFSSGTASLANRTATITATAGVTAQIPIQISGSTLAVSNTSGNTVPNDGTSPVTVTFIAKDALGNGLVGAAYTASWTTGTGGQLTITPTSGVTDQYGKFTITVSGVAASSGTATVSASAAGSTASASITVSPVAGTFGITQTSNSTGPVVTTNPSTVAMRIGDSLTVTVSAPTPTTSVVFTTTMGTWLGSGTTTQTVTVAGGVASAVLQQSVAGVANVQVNDPSNTSRADTLSVGVTATTPYSITLTASPSVVPKSSGSTIGASTLIAKVLDINGQPVGNAAIAFSMTNTTGGGESISPVVAYTATIAGGTLGLGEASATFTSGSLSSASTGVQIRATVLGSTPLVATNTLPSGNDASVVIGGTAGSVAFGIATKVVVLNTTTYQLPMSVLVADSNGNAVANQIVNLSIVPVGWSTGTQAPCAVDTDTATTGTFLSEDMNGNLALDPGEDGYRYQPGTGLSLTGGTKDGQLTPVNSAAGTLPSSVTTDAYGVANFYLTYLKTNAMFTIVRVRATTVVLGTESASQIVFQLPWAQADAGTTAATCYLASPYFF